MDEVEVVNDVGETLQHDKVLYVMGKKGSDFSEASHRGKAEISGMGRRVRVVLMSCQDCNTRLPNDMSRPTLAQQLKQLEGEERTPVDPESAYSNLDSLELAKRTSNEGREHYLDVGPSRLRGQFGDMGERYGGQVRGRQKIFDDDDDEEDDDDDEGGGNGLEDEDEDEDDEDDDDEEGEEDEEDKDEDEEEDGDDDDDEEEEDDGEYEEEDLPDETAPRPTSSSTSKLDPIAALRDSRQKDVEKGKSIKRQKVSTSPMPCHSRRIGG